MDGEDDPRAVLEPFFERTIEGAEHVWLVAREVHRSTAALQSQYDNHEGEYEGIREDISSIVRLVDNLAVLLIDLVDSLREASRMVLFIEEICRNIELAPDRDQHEAANRVASFATGSRRGPREIERAMYNLQQRQARAAKAYLTENFSMEDMTAAFDGLKTLERAVQEVNECATEARTDLLEGVGQQAIKDDLEELRGAALATVADGQSVHEAVELAFRNY